MDCYTKSHTGKGAYQYKGGKPKCLDCGELTTQYNTKRCHSCYIKTMKGETAPNFKGWISRDRAHYDNIYRTLRNNAEGGHTPQEWLELKVKYLFMCLCCKRQEPEILLTRDHIIPLTKGGTNDISNIQPLCRVCNSIKHDKAISYLSGLPQMIELNQKNER